MVSYYYSIFLNYSCQYIIEKLAHNVLVADGYGILAGEAAEAEAAVAGGCGGGQIQRFQQPLHRNKVQAVRPQCLAQLVGAAGVADQVLAVRRVNAEVAGVAYRRRTYPYVHLPCARAPK